MGREGTLAEDRQENLEVSAMRPLVWVGIPRKNIQEYPTEAPRLMGGGLQLLQYGGKPQDAKPFKGIGSGIVEIALRREGEAYRTNMALKLSDNRPSTIEKTISPVGGSSCSRPARCLTRRLVDSGAEHAARPLS